MFFILYVFFNKSFDIATVICPRAIVYDCAEDK